MKVTLGGPPGAGKTTVADLLSKQTGWPLISAGEMFRREAEARGLSLPEFGRRAERDPRLDRAVDRRQAAEAARHRNAIVEGRLAAHFIPKADLRVWITAPLEVRAARVARREGVSVATARRQVRERERCEARRYRRWYNIEMASLEPYQLVLDSSRWGPQAIARVIRTAISAAKR
ncbi:MAG: cytidylate kinase family protein [Halobacteria archaeon]